MKTFFTTISVLFFLFGYPSTQFSMAETDDTIIAVVNKEIVTLKELHNYLRAIYMQIKSEGLSDKETQDTMAFYETNGLNKLIEDKLLLDEANKKEMTVRPKAIDDKLAEMEKQYGSEEEFLRSILKEGMTVTELRKKIEDQIKVKFLIDTEVRSKIFVNPNEVTDYYQAHHDDFNHPDGLDLESIFIPYKDQTRTNPNPLFVQSEEQAAMQKANEALAALKKGEAFSDVAKKYSSLPNIGTIRRGQMVETIENAVFHLNENDVSEPVKTQTGIYIFKAKAKLPPQTSSLEEVKTQINNMLFNQKFKTRMVSWLDDLKKKAYIELKG